MKKEYTQFKVLTPIKKTELGETGKNINLANVKPYIPLQKQRQYMPHMINFPYGTQPPISADS